MVTWFGSWWHRSTRTPEPSPNFQELAEAQALSTVKAIAAELLLSAEALDAAAYHLRESGKRKQASLTKQAAGKARTAAGWILQ